MLSVKQGGIKYHFLSLWYDSTWDWTQVSRAVIIIIIVNIIILLLARFLLQFQLEAINWSLSDSKSSQVFQDSSQYSRWS